MPRFWKGRGRRNCPNCWGQGYEIVEDGGQGTARRCRCTYTQAELAQQRAAETLEDLAERLESEAADG